MRDPKKDHSSNSSSDASGSGGQTGRSKHRSPNYPYVSLKRGIELARKLFEADKRLKVHPNLVMKLFGFKEGGSSGIQTLAALDSYGLIESEGKGEQKRIGVSELVVKYIFATSPEEQRVLLAKSALRPSINLKVWEQFHHQVPRDEVLRQYLVVDLNFNSETVDGFISKFKETIEFAGLLDGDYTDGGRDESSDGPLEDDQMETVRTQSPSRVIAPTASVVPPQSQISPVSAVPQGSREQELKFRLRSGEARLVIPENMDASDYKILQAYLVALELSLPNNTTKVTDGQEN